MPRHSLTVNGETVEVDVASDMPLLWVLRDVLGLTGTKYGCGVAQCGSCTVLIGEIAARACTTPIDRVRGDVTTIEGLGGDHALQRAWLVEDVSQCGYCQPGQIMSALGLLRRHPAPTERQIDQAMRGNLCRCGTYGRIRKAIRTAAGPPPPEPPDGGAPDGG